jgi:hypothetical protein
MKYSTQTSPHPLQLEAKGGRGSNTLKRKINQSFFFARLKMQTSCMRLPEGISSFEKKTTLSMNKQNKKTRKPSGMFMQREKNLSFDMEKQEERKICGRYSHEWIETHRAVDLKHQ